MGGEARSVPSQGSSLSLHLLGLVSFPDSWTYFLFLNELKCEIIL